MKKINLKKLAIRSAFRNDFRMARVCLFFVLLLYTITITKTKTKKSRDPLKMKKINLKKLAIRSAFRNDQK